MADLTIIPAGRGTRHTGSWVTDQRPKQFREGFMFLDPNGDTPLTALMGLMKTEKPTDPEFSHFTKYLPYQAGAITGVFNDEALSSAYAAGVNAVGKLLYIKCASDTAKEFRPGYTALLRDESLAMNDTPTTVLQVVENGASSFIKVRTLVATTAASATALARDPATADRIVANGQANAQGGSVPDVINYNPNKYTNYCQIFWTPYSITNTMKETRLRTGDALAEEKREKFKMHGVMMEKAFLWGQKASETVDGKEKLYTQGIVEMVREHVPANEVNYITDAAYAGQEWEIGGYDWLCNHMEIASRYGKLDRLAFCGSKAMLGIRRLAEVNREVQITQNTAELGFAVETLRLGPLKLHLKQHGLMTHESTYRSDMIIFDTAAFKEMALRSTHKTVDTLPGTDGQVEGWRTETGMSFTTPASSYVLHGVGEDS